jgi:hypothetical protein
MDVPSGFDKWLLTTSRAVYGGVGRERGGSNRCRGGGGRGGGAVLVSQKENSPQKA